MKRLLPATLLLLLLVGCQNPYAGTFKSTPLPVAEPYLLPHVGGSLIIPIAGDLGSELKSYEKRGYAVIGYAVFETVTEDYTSALREKAQEVQADTVLLKVVSKGARREVLALKTANPLQGAFSGSSGYALAGAGGRAPSTNNMQSSSANMNNSAPDMVMSTQNVSQYTTVFLRKRSILLGANVDLLDSNASAVTGLVVLSIIENSPADRADLRRGDVITAVNGQTVTSLESYQKMLAAHAGGVVRLSLIRKNVEGVVGVELNSLPSQQ